MALFQALLGTVLPVFILAALGYLARVWLKVEVRDPSRLAIYVMVPGLIMYSILTASLEASQVGQILVFELLLTVGMLAITALLVRSLGWRHSEQRAAMLGSAFMNCANYGLPVVLLAFGKEGFDRAAVFVVLQSLLLYSVAVYIAASGRMDWRQAVRAVFRMPMIWSALIALTLRLLNVDLPLPLLRPLELLADGAVVMGVLLLGLQVAEIQLKGAGMQVGLAVLLRLVVSPLLGLLLVALLRPDPLTGKVLILEAAMPAAVNATLLATEFGTEPEQVSGTTLVSTLLSLVTVTFWVWFLG